MPSSNGQQGSSSGRDSAPAHPPAPTRRPSLFSNDDKNTNRKRKTQGLARYKPLSSLVNSGSTRTRPSTVASSRREPPPGNNEPTLGTIDENEADIMSVMTELAGNLQVPRYKFEAPQDPEAARIMRIITEYLEETQVESKVLGICQSLLAKPQLPYNPYPEMILRLRCFAERFHMLRKDIKSLKALLENPVIPTSIPSVFGVESCDNVWGLKDMVRVINPTSLKVYDWLLSNHMPQEIDFEDNQHDFNGQVLIALIAPCIFQGTFHKDVASFTVRLHYILYGRNPSMSTRIFVDQIVQQVNTLTSPDSPHVLLKAVTIVSPKSSGVSEWNFHLIDDRQEKFRRALLDTITAKTLVTLEGVFLVDPNKSIYKRGRMEFNFHFVESTNNGRERLKSYESFPYKTLFEGVFWKRAHAEAYYSLFNNPEMESASQTSVRSSGKSSVKKKPETASVTTVKKTTGITANMKEAFKQKQKQEVAMLYDVPDAYEISQHVLLFSLVDRGKLNVDILVELCQLHQSTSAQLLTCIQYNHTIQDIIKSAPGLSNEYSILLKIIERLFEDYQKKLLPLLDNSLFARSSDVQTSHNIISVATNKCNQLLGEEKFLPKPFLELLVQMNSHCTVLLYQLTEDALALCPKLKEAFDHCREIFPDDVPRPQTRAAQDKQELTKKKSKKVLVVTEETFTHGTQIKDINRQENMVLDVEEVIESSNRPKIMAIEGALMQYLIDTKLDEVWNVFLNGLLFSDPLPPNPYPKLVTLFRQTALRMRFNAENDEKVIKRVLQQKAKVHNQKNFIYTVAGSNMFGHVSALSVLDTTFNKARLVAQMFARKEYLQRRGQLQISLSLAMTNMGSFYGLMMPYLNILYLSEFCYIRGPMGSDRESILLYTKMILDDVQHIGGKQSIIVTGLHVGQSQFTLEDIVKNPDFFHTKLSSAIENKEVIFLQIYKALGWRIMPIQKQYCLFYIYVDGTVDRQEAYFPQMPQSLYCNIFLSPTEACSHYAQLSSGSNPFKPSKIQTVSTSLKQQILQSLTGNNLLKAYQLILIKSLIEKQTNCLADIWHMFHCQGPALEYLRHLNIAMQEIVKHALNVMQVRGVRTADVINRDEHGFDGKSLGKMMTAYQQKLESVLDNSCSFAPQSLWHVIKRKLQLITERTQVSKELILCIEKQTIEVLEEVNNLLEPLQAWILEDMHCTCSNVQQEFKAIQTAARS